jgi:hypothetical protein
MSISIYRHGFVPTPKWGVVSIVQDATKVEWATVDLHASWSDELAIADT